MGGYIKRDVERKETTALNTKVNKKIFDEFKDHCKEMGYPMNVMIETFMQQYANGRFNLSANDILKWKTDEAEAELETLNTTFNKEIYLTFKAKCKGNSYFVKHVIMAFMEKFASKNLTLEYVWFENRNL